MTSPIVVLVDLDGTLYDAGVAVDGASEAMKRLRAAGYILRFVTNTDSQALEALATRLGALGIAVQHAEIFTPVVAAQRVLDQRRGARVVLLANDAVRDELAPHCTLVAFEAAEEATHVIVGDCRDGLSYPALDAAFRAVRAGAELIALQPGRYFRAADGAHLDTGAVVAAVEYAAETTARVLGKPALEFLDLAVSSADASADRDNIWVVGDDRATDIYMGNAARAVTVQVRTGKFADQAERTDLAVARHVIGSVAELPELIESAASS